MDIYSTRNKIKIIITILKDTSLELSKASLLTPFYGSSSSSSSRCNIVFRCKIYITVMVSKRLERQLH